MNIQPAWNFNFIFNLFFDELNVKNIKTDNFIMKYAKRKRKDLVKL